MDKSNLPSWGTLFFLLSENSVKKNAKKLKKDAPEAPRRMAKSIKKLPWSSFSPFGKPLGKQVPKRDSQSSLPGSSEPQNIASRLYARPFFSFSRGAPKTAKIHLPGLPLGP